jgi:hypothetical protein
MQILKDRGYDGPLSIHGEYPVEKSIELTSNLAQADLDYIRRILAE